MAAESVLKNVDINHDDSPYIKKTKYEYDLESVNRWTLTKNQLVLHSVYDMGIDQLENDGNSEFDIKQFPHIETAYPVYTPESKKQEIRATEASLPENTLQKLYNGDFDHLLVKKEKLPSTSNINYFDLLSDEVVLQVFQKLPKSELNNVALVCRRFNRLSEDESLWTRMDICNKKLEKGAFGIIMSRQVIVLRLARSHILHPPILPNVRAALPDYHCRLMYLDLSMATISTESLTIIFYKCNRLKKLSLENVSVNNDVLLALSNNYDLEVLNFAMSLGIEKEGLQPLLANCIKLRELNISWTYLNYETIEFICKHLPVAMDRFNFSGCRKLLQDQNIADLVLRCPNIRELDLSDCTSLTGDAIRQITVLDDLNFLALSRCYSIPYRSLMYLKSIKSLSYLDIHGGYINPVELKIVKDGLGNNVNINKFKFSSVARPTVGMRRSSIWNMKIHD